MFCQCDSPRSDVKSSAIKYSRPLVGNRVPVEKINVRKFKSALMQADLNESGVVEITDLYLLLYQITGTLNN